MATVMSLLLTACADGGSADGEAESSTSINADDIVTPTPSPSSSLDGVGPGGEIDVPAGAGQTPERLIRLAETAAMFGLQDLPEVDVVRVVGPEEYVDVQLQCQEDMGFTRDENGSYNAPPDQYESLGLAVYTCEAKFPMEEKYLQPLGEPELRRLHAYFVDDAVPCLASIGYSIPGPPSIETFLASANSPSAYLPSGELFALGLVQSQVEEALTDCPEVPPPIVLYGE